MQKHAFMLTLPLVLRGMHFARAMNVSITMSKFAPSWKIHCEFRLSITAEHLHFATLIMRANFFFHFFHLQLESLKTTQQQSAYEAITH